MPNNSDPLQAIIQGYQENNPSIGFDAVMGQDQQEDPYAPPSPIGVPQQYAVPPPPPTTPAEQVGDLQARLKENRQRLEAGAASTVGAAWERGKRSLGSLYSLGAAATGQAIEPVAPETGSALRDWGTRKAEELDKEAEMYREGRVTQLEDVGSLGDAGELVMSALGEVAPSIVESIGAAVIGGVIGSTVPGAGTAVGAATGAVGKGAAKGFLKRYLEKSIAEKVAKGAAKDVAEKAAARAVGATMAVFGSSYLQGVGDIYGETLNDEQKGNLLSSFTLALPYAALDSIVEIGAAKRIFRGSPGDKALRRYTRAAFATGMKEGSTEAVQEALLLGAGLAEGKEYTSGEVLSRLGNSFFLGAIAGGVMGTPGGRHGAKEAEAPKPKELEAPKPKELGEAIADAIPGAPEDKIYGIDRDVLRDALTNGNHPVSDRARAMAAALKAWRDTGDTDLANSFHDSFANALATGTATEPTPWFTQNVLEGEYIRAGEWAGMPVNAPARTQGEGRVIEGQATNVDEDVRRIGGPNEVQQAAAEQPQLPPPEGGIVGGKTERAGEGTRTGSTQELVRSDDNARVGGVAGGTENGLRVQAEAGTDQAGVDQRQGGSETAAAAAARETPPQGGRASDTVSVVSAAIDKVGEDEFTRRVKQRTDALRKALGRELDPLDEAVAVEATARNITGITRGTENAESVREDAGQAQEPRAAGQPSEGEGGKDIQQQPEEGGEAANAPAQGEIISEQGGTRQGTAPTQRPDVGVQSQGETKDVAMEGKTPAVPQKRLSRAERAKIARLINVEEDDILAAVAKAGGLNREEAEAQGIDPAEFSRRGFSIYRVFTKNGDSFDGMAERLAQYGYPVGREGETYSANGLLDAVDNALRGKSVLTPEGHVNEAEKRAPEDAELQSELSALDALEEQEKPAPDAKRMADLLALSEKTLGDEETNTLIGRLSEEMTDAPDSELLDAFEQEISDARDRKEGIRAPGESEDFALKGETEQEIRDREAAKRDEEERVKAEEQKQQADAERADFVLSGSDSVSDTLAARGQKDLVSSIQEKQQKSAGEKLEASANEDLGRDRLANTAHRARMAADADLQAQTGVNSRLVVIRKEEGQQKFSRPEPTPSSRVQARKKPRGIPVEQAQRVADTVGANLLGKSGSRIRIRVVAKQSDAFGVNSYAQGGLIRGAYDPETNSVVLIAENLNGAAEARQVLRHEIRGHVGWELLQKKDRAEFAKRVLAATERTKWLGELRSQVEAQEGPNASHELIAEEVFARVAESGRTVFGSAWDNMLRWVAGKLRSLGLDWVNDDAAQIRAMQDDLAAAVRVGREEKVEETDTGDIRYSRVGEDITAFGQDLIDKVRGAFKERPSGKNLNFWNRTVGTPFHLAKKFPETFGKFFDRLQEFNHDASQFAILAEAKAPGLFANLERGLKESLKSATNVMRNVREKRIAPVAKAINEGTLGEKIWSDAELEKRGLDAVQRGLYHEALRAAHQSLDSTAQTFQVSALRALLNTFYADPALSKQQRRAQREKLKEIAASIQGKNVAEAVDLAEAVVEPIREFLRDGVRDANGLLKDARSELKAAQEAKDKDRIDQAQAVINGLDKRIADNTKSQQKIDATIKSIESIAERVEDLKRKGYFPLMRFGRFTVTVWQKNEETGKDEAVWFSKHETESQQKEAYDALLKEATDEQTVKMGTSNQEESTLFQGLNMDTLQLFSDSIDTSSDEGQQYHSLIQEYIRLGTAEHSALKRKLHRKGTAGYSDDAQRVLASYIVSNGRLAASNLHQGDVMHAITDIPQSDGDLREYATKLHNYLRQPTEEFSGVRQAMFVWYLGGSAASALVNLSQVPMVTYPALSARGGISGAAKAINRAYAKTLRGGMKAPDSDQSPFAKSVRKAREDAILAPQQLYELQATARGGGIGVSKALNNPLTSFARNVWGAGFAAAEQINREVTFAAAWEVAKSKGDSDKAAYDYAVDMVNQTQYVYNRTNRSQWGRGIGAPLMTFKSFTVQTLELWSRLPAKEKILMASLLVAAAGITGLPGEEDAEDLIDTIMKLFFGKAFESRKVLEDAVYGALGETVGEMVMSGALAHGPADLSSRLGFANIIPGTRLLMPGNVGDSREVGEIFGPISGIAKDISTGIEAAGDRDWSRAGYSLLPRAIKNAVDGAVALEGGEAVDRRGRDVTDITPIESLIKLIGFNPTKVARIQEDKWRLMNRDKYRRSMESAIANRMARAAKDQDRKAQIAARQELIDWNQNNPDDRIVINAAQIKRRVRALKMIGTERFLRSMSPELREEAARALQE